MTEPNAQIVLLNAVSVMRGAANHTHDELLDLADAASMVGLDRMAKRLSALAEYIVHAADDLNKAHGEAVYDTLVVSERATINMMNGILAGVEIAKAGA